MNVDRQPAGLTGPVNPHVPRLEPIYRALSWSDVVGIRALNPKCNPTKATMTAAAVHPDSVFGREIETRIGKTVTGEPTRNAEQATALRRLAVLEDHEVTLDLMRDTGLPTELAVDLLRRLLSRPTGWTLFERLSLMPNLHYWAQAVLTREEETHVADDILTLRILQLYGHDVAVPWSFDMTNKWVFFYSAAREANDSLGRLIDFATLDRPNCYAMRDTCRKAYQALAYCHHGEGGQIWPHWEVGRGMWEIHPDPREGTFIDDIVSSHAVTCDTERWLRDVTLVGALDVYGYSPRVGPDYQSDLSDPENVACDPRRPRIAPGDLRERLAVIAAHRRPTRQVAPSSSSSSSSRSSPSLANPPSPPPGSPPPADVR